MTKPTNEARLKLWLIERTDNVGYDEYDAAVVAAPTPRAGV